MFAVGMVLLFLVIAIGADNDTKAWVNASRGRRVVAGAVALLGCVLMLASLIVFVWRVLP